MITENLGGPDATYDLIEKHYHKICCCFSPNANGFYRHLLLLLKIFLFVRVPIVAIGSICDGSGNKPGFVIVSLINSVLYYNIKFNYILNRLQ